MIEHPYLGTLYVASSNPGKLRDFAAAATVFRVAIEELPGLASIEPPAEDGDSFEANARQKAVAYSRTRPELLVIADDSGLEVGALDGAPGVRSARYADDAGFVGMAHTVEGDVQHTDHRNNLYLLERLRETGMPQPWPARYRCVLALARSGEVIETSEGSVAGQILAAPRGSFGFGYDPLFWLPEQGRSMAEVDPESRQNFSHRGRALAALLKTFGDRTVLKP